MKMQEHWKKTKQRKDAKKDKTKKRSEVKEIEHETETLQNLIKKQTNK